jgi:CheY-like chemotaxis protein
MKIPLGVGGQLLDKEYKDKLRDSESKQNLKLEADNGNYNKDQLALAAGRILLVEDDQVSKRLCQLQLRILGYTVDYAENGLEALEKVCNNDYALILMDSNMPVMDGFQASREIRALEQGTARHIPIIALTARAISGDRELCLEAGMDDYLSKPASLNAVSQVLDRWLRFNQPNELNLAEISTCEAEKAILLEELMPIFLETMEGRLLKLDEAYEQGDWEKLSKVAHTTISSSLAIGAGNISQTVSSIEFNIKKHNYANVSILLSRLHAEYLEIEALYYKQK